MKPSSLLIISLIGLRLQAQPPAQTQPPGKHFQPGRPLYDLSTDNLQPIKAKDKNQIISTAFSKQ